SHLISPRRISSSICRCWPIGQQRQMLLEFRGGVMKWDQLDELRKTFQKEFDRAFSSTSLPERPDYARANELLIQARMKAMSN
ncbi:MAG: hypothetical protein ACKOOI_02175, partial [Pirellula sp.]